jgi:putative membrane-bound dehydrogenase-like protein
MPKWHLNSQHEICETDPVTGQNPRDHCVRDVRSFITSQPHMHQLFRIPARRPVRAWRFLVAILIVAAPAGAETTAVFNSEKSTELPLSATAAAAQWDLPPGFQATAFATEPDVRQPIAMCLDDRGRLWVAESYMYAGHGGGYYEAKLRDRIVILEDTNHDGIHDIRTVFVDGLERLTSIEVGFGGIWALTLPHLVFFADSDRDDKPDSTARIVLDGFDHKNSGHTMANGLRWGPDGWLYGRQGILGTSLIGKPGLPDDQRTRVNTGIWRYHPQRGTTELVCEGTTNPWGMDWNAHGEAFFINTVIGHLWHVIPGAHYERMFGEDHNPHVYELIGQHADHVHWDTAERWDEIRQGMSKESSSAGGGHAHTGLMVYLGDNWPEEYRGDLFTINFHGRRLNRELLENSGGGYVGRHRADMAFSADPWFRGIDLLYGPDGGVFVSDWSDTGECHDDDGVHRLSGRVYKITHGAPAAPAVRDVQALPTAELLPLLQHPNEWFARRARLQIQQRAAAGDNLTDISNMLRQRLAETGDLVLRLRAMWALHAAGHAHASLLRALLADPEAQVRIWALRLLLDDATHPVDAETQAAILHLAETENSPRVRLALASALQRLPLDQRAEVAQPLLAHAEDATDPNLPKMLWYGIEPLGESLPTILADLAKHCAIPLVRVQIARRLTSDSADPRGALDSLLRHAADANNEWRRGLLEGMTRALEGLRGVTPPTAWPALSTAIETSADVPVRDLARRLGLSFGDPRAIQATLTMVGNESAAVDTRQAALRELIHARVPGLRDLCHKSFGTAGLTATAAEGLSLDEEIAAADWILKNFQQIPAEEKSAVIGVMIARKDWAARLLDEVAAGTIPATDIGAFHVRQIRSLNDPNLNAQLATLWGEVRDTRADKQAAIAQWERYLTPKTLANGDKQAGRAIYAATCGACHKLYGQGGTLGPDLTGGGRDNLSYLLTNIIDPSAVLAKENQLSNLTLEDGRILSGMIRGNDGRVTTLVSPAGEVIVSNEDVTKTDTLPVSLMPEGLLDTLTREQARDLFAWLMDKNPVPDTPLISITGEWEITIRPENQADAIVLQVSPPIYQNVESEAFPSLPLYNANGGGWNNGTKFIGNLAEECSTPLLVDATSVQLRAGADPSSAVFERGTDWEMHDHWGTFGRLPGGAIRETTPVVVRYRHTSLRLDSIVRDVSGRIVIRQGTGASAAPEPPALTEGDHLLANIWIPGPIQRLTDNHLFPILETQYPPESAPRPQRVGEKFPHLIEKLRRGEPLRILAWGDSVTDAAYLPKEDRWQEQFVEKLRERFPKATIELITEAWGGRTTSAYLNEPPGSPHNYQEKVLAAKPDLVISEFVNDAGLPPEHIRTQYASILADFNNIGASWIILTPHYVMPSWMGLDRERDIDDDPRPYVAELRKFAADQPVLLADAARRYGRLWRQGIPYTSLMVNSINHPNAPGMKLFADALLEVFQE